MVIFSDMIRLLLIALLTAAGNAATVINITTRLADVPAGTDLPTTAAKLDALKGVTVISAPDIALKENVEGAIEVAQATAVPGGNAVPLGVKVTVKAKMTEKGNIWLSGLVTDRSRSGGEKDERLETSGFATRELYFSGWTPNQGTVVLRTSPATAKTKKDGRDVAKSRELVIYMTIEKTTVAGPSTQKPTQGKPAAKKETPSKAAPKKMSKKK